MMIQMRHTGIYVKDLLRMAAFYREVFHMYTLSENIQQIDPLIADLFRTINACVKITKLITEKGKESGSGDMIELIEVLVPKNNNIKVPQPITAGMHIAFGVRDIEATRAAIFARGGISSTRVHDMGRYTKCCFCRDPEGNWLELIERKEL